VKRVLIGGIGNVLLGDDGVGPYVLRLLEAMYEFAPGVETVDLGTPALDLLYRIADIDLLILIDAVNDGRPAGTVSLFQRADLMRHVARVRMDPHSPAIGESLLAAELLGTGPQDVLLVGITIGRCDSGCTLSEPTAKAAGPAIRVVLEELERHHVPYTRRFGVPPDIWWAQDYEPHLA
jgi:hydrogenase maturation protease